MRETPPKSIQSVMKSYNIITALLGAGGAGVSELADEVGLHPSTVHAHLASLCECGLVVKDGTEYRMSLRFLEFGDRLRNAIPMYQKGRTEITAVARETGEMTNMAVREGNELVVIHMSEGDNAIEKQTPVGKRNHLHCTGMGKAILAELSEERVHRIVDDVGLPASTSNTITAKDELFDALKNIRQQGYALDAEELYEGVYCVATSVKRGDDLAGAISVTGPARRFSNEQYQADLRRSLLEAANVIELNLKFHS